MIRSGSIILCLVIPGLDPGIARHRQEMAGSIPAMTICRVLHVLGHRF